MHQTESISIKFDVRNASNVSRIVQKHSPLLVLVALITWFWWPSLWSGQVIVHADAAHHGLSLLSFLSDALHGERELLWDSGVYGGHPLFAEGQGGFANPLNILCAYLFEPEYGIGVFHWLSMLLSGGGVYCLSLTLGVRPWAAVFASLAVVFSGVWIGFQYNLSVSGALAWLPWLLASVEHWLNRPTLWRSSLMALAAALLIFAGYPHIAHGAAIYLVVRLSALLFTRASRSQTWNNRKRLIQLGIYAVVLAVGLSAVQLLPLIELIGQSHRGDGVDLIIPGVLGVDAYARGLLFFFNPSAEVPLTMPSLSSCFVAWLFGLVLFAKPSVRIVGHAIAALILLNLGMELASPIFKLLYDGSLIPGLHNYRAMHPFLTLAIVGMALVAAYVLDNLAAMVSRLSASKATIFLVVLYCLIWLFLIFYIYDPAITWMNLFEPVIFIVLIGSLSLLGRLRNAPAVAVFLYATGTLVYKSDVFTFYETAVLRQPESVRMILQDAQLAEFKASSGGEAGIFVFIPSNDPSLGKQYQHYLKSISPFPALAWGVPSIDGVLGLALARRMLIQPQFDAEIEGAAPIQPGSRIIDVLGVKYMSRHTPTDAASLELIHRDIDDGVLIYRNNQARPRFQLYQHAEFVNSPEMALQQLVESKPGVLFLEGPQATTSLAEPSCEADSEQSARLEVSQATSRHYQMAVTTDCPVWLFVADANYPGWQANVDGAAVALYSAQVLGKAVRIPSGEHRIQIDYMPRSFYIGLSITIGSLVLVFISLLLTLRKRYQS